MVHWQNEEPAEGSGVVEDYFAAIEQQDWETVYTLSSSTWHENQSLKGPDDIPDDGGLRESLEEAADGFPGGKARDILNIQDLEAFAGDMAEVFADHYELDDAGRKEFEDNAVESLVEGHGDDYFTRGGRDWKALVFTDDQGWMIVDLVNEGGDWLVATPYIDRIELPR